jgi:hypothetical protein
VVDSASLKVVGVAFQSLNGQDVENIGYVVPVTVVQHFLEDFRRHQRYTGWCALGIGFCTLESPQFRAYLGMPQGDKAATGVMIHDVPPTAAAHGFLAPDDVLLSVDGVPIANDGTIPFRRGERVSERVCLLCETVDCIDNCPSIKCLRTNKKKEKKEKPQVCLHLVLSLARVLVDRRWPSRTT